MVIPSELRTQVTEVTEETTKESDRTEVDELTSPRFQEENNVYQEQIRRRKRLHHSRDISQVRKSKIVEPLS